MTSAELQSEHDYRVNERLGILCGSDSPTPQQLDMSTRDADETLETLKQENQ